MTNKVRRMAYPWPDPTNERIKKLEAENRSLRAEIETLDALLTEYKEGA